MHLRHHQHLKIFYFDIYDCQAGIVIQDKSQMSFIEKHHDLIDSILVLAIKNPGFSGQQFEMQSLGLISAINNHKYRNKISSEFNT